MPCAINIQDLSKRYVISHKSSGVNATLRDDIYQGAKSFAVNTMKLFSGHKPWEHVSSREEFWALKDVGFEIEQGERLGIIGRNGAGKSTMLKILSRVTEPTSGRIAINGRVASLLEVGTGFHPDLTGRENIYLNGAILGMSRKEIAGKFDEIVDFADVEKFLDTPVKRYSSGMYVRLAFAVAAHLEPEILIVDEVLAVGDAQFQKKCIGKMEKAGTDGRTIIFVSHNMNAIERLCTSALYLDKGQVKLLDKDVGKVITSYVHGDVGAGRRSEWLNTGSASNYSWFNPKRLAIFDDAGNVIDAPFRNDNDVFVFIEIELRELDPSLTFGFSLEDENGIQLYRSYQTDNPEDSWPSLKKGINKLICKLPKHMLNEGSYSLELIASLYQRQWLIEPGSGKVKVSFSIRGGLSASPYWTAKRVGVLAPVLDWQLIESEDVIWRD